MKDRLLGTALGLIMIFSGAVNGQWKLLPDKPGSFKVVDWGVHRFNGSEYTKAEKDANYKKLLQLTELIKKNPVMGNPVGFDCEATLFSKSYDLKNGYGMPSMYELMIKFFFKNEKGKEVRFNIEPPHWDIEINNINNTPGGCLGYSAKKPDEKPKDGFSFEKWKSAADKLTNLIYAPGKKETIIPGLDRYGYDYHVVYNPDRPPYWVPVTIREAFTLLISFWKEHPDKLESDLMLSLIEPEYAKYSESEKEGLAYSGGIGGIGPDPNSAQIYRVNKEYWNRKLPRSAIQFMQFYYPSNERDIEREMEEKLKNGAGTYHIQRFLKELDITLFTSIIDK